MQCRGNRRRDCSQPRPPGRGLVCCPSYNTLSDLEEHDWNYESYFAQPKLSDNCGKLSRRNCKNVRIISLKKVPTVRVS